MNRRASDVRASIQYRFCSPEAITPTPSQLDEARDASGVIVASELAKVLHRDSPSADIEVRVGDEPIALVQAVTARSAA